MTIPYEISGADAGEKTHVSVLVLDREYTPGNTNGAAILFYSALDSAACTGGTFLLPDGCALNGWGTDYHVYLLAENMGGALETDYASVPVPVNIPEF